MSTTPYTWQDVEKRANEIIDEWEMAGETADGREGFYTPNAGEVALLCVFMLDLLADDQFTLLVASAEGAKL